MRAFAQEPTATQQIESATPGMPGRATSVRDGAVNSLLHLQRTVGNRAVQGFLHAQAASVAHSPAVATTLRVNTPLRVPQQSTSRSPSAPAPRPGSVRRTKGQVARAEVEEALEPPLRQDMQQRFGYDFPRARVPRGLSPIPPARHAQQNATLQTKLIVSTPGAPQLSRNAQAPAAPAGPGVAPGLATPGARPVDPPEVLDRLKTEAKADALKIKQLLHSNLKDVALWEMGKRVVEGKKADVGHHREVGRQAARGGLSRAGRLHDAVRLLRRRAADADVHGE